MLLDSRKTPYDRILKVAGHLLFATLFIYSIVYAIERTSYVDSAWQFFNRINQGGFLFPSNRYGVIFSQIPVFIGAKVGLSVQSLVYLHSISFPLLYYTIWIFTVYKLKNHSAGLTILLGLFIGVREGIVHPVTETQQCLAYSGLLYAILSFEWRRSIWKWVSVVGCALLISFTHPIAVFSGGFVAVLIMTERRTMLVRESWVVILTVVLFAVWRFISPIDQYDAEIYSQLKTTSDSESMFSSGPLHFLAIQTIHFYWLPEIMLLVTLVWLVVKKDWLKSILLFCGLFGYLLIAGQTFKSGDSSILMERAILPACFMVALVFSTGLLSMKNTRKWIVTCVLLFIFINGIRFINIGCLMYKKRTAYLDELVQKAIAQGNDKYMLTDATTDKEKIIIPWALGTETLLYSKFKYDQCVSISMKDESCQPTEVRITGFMCMPVNDLNPNYFKLSENPYTELK